MRTRVVFNQKGGVGKSSITVNLAAISAYQGLKTLVIDLDPQANSSQFYWGMMRRIRWISLHWNRISKTTLKKCWEQPKAKPVYWAMRLALY